MTLRASACGKIILLGEHAAVYGFPAIALPVRSLRATAELAEGSGPLRIDAPDIRLSAALTDLPADHPLAFCVRHACEGLAVPPPGGRLTVTSDIPVASGLGSGAAVSTAVVRVLALAAGRTLRADEVSTVVYDVERIHHGTPSGVDNPVIAFERPVFFVRGMEPEIVAAGAPMMFLIADSGVRSPTREAVDGVRERRGADPDRYDGLFRRIGALAETGRAELERGNREALGRSMNECHALLEAVGVGTAGLSRLASAARSAGALGAKLSGAGLGGNVIALAEGGKQAAVESAFRESGAVAVYRMDLDAGTIPPPPMKNHSGA